MATNQEFMDYVYEQLSVGGEITYRKMFGEYTIYCAGKVLGLACDNQVFIKPTNAGLAMLQDAEMASPYDGAKPCIVLADLEDRAFLADFIKATCAELPMPKPKKPKKIVEKK